MRNFVEVWKFTIDGKSASNWTEEHGVCVEYKLNQIAVPKVGKIFCFDKEVNAINFSKSHWGRAGQRDRKSVV